jgi:5-methylcytosine-specific restriction endonuclease McrA
VGFHLSVRLETHAPVSGLFFPAQCPVVSYRMRNERAAAMSTSRRMPGGWVDRRSLPLGPGGHPLCRWCNLEVPAGRFTFCSDWCVHEWKLRSNPGYLRERVFERDRGVCAACGIDTAFEWKRLRRSRGVERARLLAEWGLTRMTRRSLWDADHILPVVEGGGECSLDNLRTLCLRCHRDATSRLRTTLKARAASGG